MGAGQSDLYKNTYGDNIDNVSKSVRNIDENKKYNVNDILDKYDLTDSQRCTAKKMLNTMQYHLKEKDFSATKGDLEGHPIYDEEGVPFQHLNEMKTSYYTLQRGKNSLEGSLQNPNLGNNERVFLQDTLNKTDYYLSRMYELLHEYGEV